MFSEKIAGLLGPSYVIAFGLGATVGVLKGTPIKARRTYRLWMNNTVNNFMKTGFRYANNTGAAILLYMLTGKSIYFIFKEEFEDFQISLYAENAIFGGVCGTIYKSTRGFRPMILGALLGATAGAAYQVVWKNGWLELL